MRGGIGTLQVNRPSPWGGAIGALGQVLNQQREEEKKKKLEEEARQRQLNVAEMHSQVLNRDIPVQDREKMFYAMAEGRNDLDPNTLSAYGQKFSQERNDFSNLQRQNNTNSILSEILNKDVPIEDRKKILYAMAEGRNDIDPKLIQGLGEMLSKEEQQQYTRNLTDQKRKGQQNVLDFLGSSMNGQGSTGKFLNTLQGQEDYDPEFAGKFVQDMMKPVPQRGITVNNSGAPASISPEDLVQLGLDEQEASTISNLYNNAAPGGKNYIMKSLVENMERQGFGKDAFSGTDGKLDSQELQGIKFPEIDNFKGLRGQEIPKKRSELFKDNTKFSSEISNNMKSHRDEKILIGTLQQLNDRGNLPEGIGKAINVDWKTGSLRVPELANADTQAYVKAVNSFLKGAKGTFGARLTDFDVRTFLSMLPTLANTSDGRELILRQMDSINKLNSLYYDSLNEVYDHYGLQKIDRQQANTISKNLRADEESEILDEYKNILSSSKNKIRPPHQEGKTAVMSKEGKVGYVPNNELDQFLKEGYKKL